MDNFIYSNPTKLLFGKGMISKIGAELQSAGIQKVLMLAGGGSIKSNGVYTEFVESMQMNSRRLKLEYMSVMHLLNCLNLDLLMK